MMKLTIVLIPKRFYFKILCLVGLCFAFSLNGASQSLIELKQLAAEENLELKALYKRFEAHLENVDQAKAWQDPNLSFGYFISPIETRVGPQVARFSLTQMLPWFGTFKTKGNIAAYRAEAEFKQFQDKKLNLFMDVAYKYYDLSALRYIAKIDVQHLNILKDIKSIVQSNYENNQVNLSDVLKVELEIERQQNVISILKDQDRAIETQLNQILNRPLSTPIVIFNPKQILELKEPMVLDSISDAHPRLQRIQNLQQMTIAKKELARKQTLPQFAFGLDYAIIQDGNGATLDAGQDAIMPMISLSLPIFGKKNKSRKKEASLQAESLQHQFKNEITSLQSEMQIAQYQYNTVLKSYELHDGQMKKLNDILELSYSALANAKIDAKEILHLYEEHVLHHKMKVKTLVELQKIKEKINYLTST